MKSIFLLTFMLFGLMSFGQVLTFTAQDSIIQVDDAGELSNWFLDFDLKPDVFTTNSLGEKVTFISGENSMSFDVTKDLEVNFVILFNGDSAFTQLKYEMSRLDLLKSGSIYDYSQKENFNFSYQSASRSELVVLRNKYKLDSIAGNGDELSQVKKLMHWVHESIEHNGNKPNPKVKNASSLLEKCSKEDQTLNCRGLAIVLNEVYLAMGFKSRYVTCMPKEAEFNDCHVINTVFIESLNKWVWMDPTWDAYVMNEVGELLSIQEVRTYLIEGRRLKVNEHANWNQITFIDPDYYLNEYMAKNLYRLECPLSSVYDLESPKRGKLIEYIELIPVDSYRQEPKMEKIKYKKTGVTNVTYKTNNPNLFWEIIE